MMENTTLQVIDVTAIAQSITSTYANVPVTWVNDHVVRLSVMTQPFYWHYHPNSDESFLVIEGILIIELEDRLVELTPGQFFTIPKKVKHLTRPGSARSVNITFESKNIETVSSV